MGTDDLFLRDAVGVRDPPTNATLELQQRRGVHIGAGLRTQVTRPDQQGGTEEGLPTGGARQQARASTPAIWVVDQMPQCNASEAEKSGG